jgi:hypothetical protein
LDFITSTLYARQACFNLTAIQLSGLETSAHYRVLVFSQGRFIHMEILVMRSRIKKALTALTIALLALSSNGTVLAGPVFITGHDPDFHAQSTASARNLLNAGLDFATGGNYNVADGNKFLWVEARVGDPGVPAVPGGHRIGEFGLVDIGLTLGAHYDRANAAELAGVNFSNYTAIAVASSFGGILGANELLGLIARSADIASFVNGGGGFFASSECFPTSGFCRASLLDGSTGVLPAVTASDLFGFLPIAVNVVAPSPPFTITAFGASLGLTNADVVDPTHNAFFDAAGLNIVDTNAFGNPVTLAGDVLIGGGGFFQPVIIDIKFCSNPNAHNCRSGGALPVTIFGAADLDVADIDLASLQLCRADGGGCTSTTSGDGVIDSSIYDRGTPGDRGFGTAECTIIEDPPGSGILEEVGNPDGFLDLDAAFDKSAVSALLDICDDSGSKGDSSVALFIQGSLLDGTQIISTPIGDDGIDQLVRKNR